MCTFIQLIYQYNSGQQRFYEKKKNKKNTNKANNAFQQKKNGRLRPRKGENKEKYDVRDMNTMIQ